MEKEILELLRRIDSNLYGIKEAIRANTLIRKNVHTSPEAAMHSGLSDSELDKLAAKRKIPFSQPGGKLRFFKRTDVEKFLLSKPVTPFIDVEREAINFVNSYAKEGGRNVSY